MTEEEQTSTEETELSCFVISEIGDAGTPPRRRADAVFEHIIKPASEAAGFTRCVRADDISTGDVISRVIIQELVGATVVVADITNHNANVFYELAIRHGFRKPVVILYDPEQSIPFDIKDIGAIPVTTGDLSTAMAARTSLTTALTDAAKNPGQFSRSPLHMWFEFESEIAGARSSGDEVSTILAELRADISDLRVEVRRSARTRTRSEAAGGISLAAPSIESDELTARFITVRGDNAAPNESVAVLLDGRIISSGLANDEGDWLCRVPRFALEGYGQISISGMESGGQTEVPLPARIDQINTMIVGPLVKPPPAE